jgi:hypothetical protein
MIRYFIEHIEPNEYWNDAFLYTSNKRLARHVVNKKHSGSLQYYDFSISGWTERSYHWTPGMSTTSISKYEFNKLILAKKLSM